MSGQFDKRQLLWAISEALSFCCVVMQTAEKNDKSSRCFEMPKLIKKNRLSAGC